MVMMVVMMMVVMVVVMVVVNQDNGGHGNMSPGQLSQVAGGRPLTHSVSGQLVHDGGHRWTSENIDWWAKMFIGGVYWLVFPQCGGL